MKSAFPRASRAIHQDSLRPGLVTLLVLLLLLCVWFLWLVAFPLPFYATSQSAEVSPDAVIVAEVSPEALKQIQVGQVARFTPELPTGQVGLDATVIALDKEQGRVILALSDDRAVYNQLEPGMRGTVQIIVQQQSPFSLLLHSVGIRPNGQ